MATIITDGTPSGGGGGGPNLGTLDTTDDPLGLYTLDGDLADTSGNGLASFVDTGTPAISYVTEGGREWALFRSGTYATIATGPASLLRTGDVSIEITVKILATSAAVPQTLFMTGTATKPAGNRLWGMVHSGYVSAHFTADHEHGTGTNVLSLMNDAADVSTPDLKWGWHHLALVRDATAKTWLLYVDGVPQVAVSYGTNATGGASGSIWLGSDELTAGTNIGCLMGNFAVYGAALTPAQVEAHADRVLGGAA